MRECSEKPLTKFWLMCLMCFRLWSFEAAGNYSSRFAYFGFLTLRICYWKALTEKQPIILMSTYYRDEFMVFLVLSYDLFWKTANIRLFTKTIKTWTVQVGLWPFEGAASNYSSRFASFCGFCLYEQVLMNLWCLQSTIWHFLKYRKKTQIPQRSGLGFGL